MVLALALVFPSVQAQTNTSNELKTPPTRINAGDLLAYSTKKQRVLIVGTVLLEYAPGYFFLRDETGTVRVRLHKTATLKRGDLVEVSGEPMRIQGRAWLELGEAKVVGTGVLPRPERISAVDAAADLYNAQIVTLTGKVVNHATYKLLGVTNEVVLIESEGISCKALFGPGTESAKLYPIGTVADFTGICRLGGRVDETDSHYVHLLVHSPEAVRVLHGPPFWSPEMLRRVLLIVSVLAAGAGVWILWQRRKNTDLEKRVAARTAELSEQVNARERAEAELRVALQAEKELNQLKSSFVSMVSHEFRTPLEIILSSSNILDRYIDRLPVDKRAAQLRAVRKAVHRMNDLIDDVLLLGKFDAGAMICTPASLDLPAFCRHVAKEIESAAARDGAIQFTAMGVDNDASADEGLLHHILANVLGNAVKYSAPNQKVEFILRRRGLDAEFVVRDFGCGIPLTDQSRLFTAFYRGSNVGHTAGSGLGLVIAKRCVDLHGGSIRCESKPGTGTKFTVTLPLFDGTRVFRRRPTDLSEPVKLISKEPALHEAP
jgi:signal transduction histidine kinase